MPIKNKIVILCPTNNSLGGISAYCHALSTALNKRGVETAIIYTSGKVKVYKLIVSLLLLIKYKIENKNIKLYCPSGSGNSAIRKCIILYFAKKLNIPYVFHMHGGGFSQWANRLTSFEIKFYASIFSKAQSVYYIDKQHMQVFMEKFNLKREKLYGIPNFVDEGPKEFCLTTFKENQIIFIGKVCNEKGVGELIDAYEESSKKFNLKIYGPIANGFNHPHLEFYYEGIINNYKWVELAKSKVFILPSKIENFPLSFIEAAKSSCLIIYSGAGCVNDYFIPGLDYIKCGIDKTDISDSIEYAFDCFESEQSELMIRRAFEKSLSFTSGKIISQLILDFVICLD